MVSLIIGITISLALVALITILSMPSEDERSFPLEMMNDEEQIHKSGFIDIPVQRIVSCQKTKDNNQMVNIKKRINQFKNRNRFYK